MISTSWIKWIGFLLLLMMAVRVSITPGIQHQHEHGELPHSHHHPHPHGHHSHSHGDQEPSTSHAESKPSRSHIHVSVFGWELTLSSPWMDDETAESQPRDAVAVSGRTHQKVETLPDGLSLSSATAWGTLIQLLLEIRSPGLPAPLELPHGNLSQLLHPFGQGFWSRDREPPVSPPPECVSPIEATC